jgi:hypothetical protein
MAPVQVRPLPSPFKRILFLLRVSRICVNPPCRLQELHESLQQNVVDSRNPRVLTRNPNTTRLPLLLLLNTLSTTLTLRTQKAQAKGRERARVVQCCSIIDFYCCRLSLPLSPEGLSLRTQRAQARGRKKVCDALPSPAVNPLEGSPKCSCGKLGLGRRSRLPTLERSRGSSWEPRD